MLFIVPELYACWPNKDYTFLMGLIKVHRCMYSEIVQHPESKEHVSKDCELHHGILILKSYCSLLCHEIFSY